LVEPSTALHQGTGWSIVVAKCGSGSKHNRKKKAQKTEGVQTVLGVTPPNKEKMKQKRFPFEDCESLLFLFLSLLFLC
jgi:hypothetical protein